MATEIELKLLLDPGDMRRLGRHPALRPLRRGRVSTRLVQSAYYDTPALDLRRAGFALRLRCDGGRWVQTLKADGGAEGGFYRREEWEWAVPDAALDLTLPHGTPAGRLLRKPELRAGLEPVFKTEFQRSSTRLEFADGTLAELCLDSGAIRGGKGSAPICEAEIELIDGNPAQLFGLALALAQDLPLRLGHASKAERGYSLYAGASARPSKALAAPLHADDHAAMALRRIAWSCIGHALANQSGVLTGKDPEYLHQVRVALRRLRAALSAFKPLLQGPLVAPVAARLRELGSILGEARDWDVFMIETLPALASGSGQVHALGAFRRRCGLRRGVSLRKARHALESAECRRLWLELGRLLAGDAMFAADAARRVPLAAFAAALLERHAQKLRQLGDRIDQLGQPGLHRMRIALKKQRYAAEFFAPLFSAKRARPYIAALAGLQELLGALHDAAIAPVLANQAAQGASGADPLTQGMVLDWSAARVHLQLAGLRRAWDRFRRQKAFWKKALHHHVGISKEASHVRIR